MASEAVPDVFTTTEPLEQMLLYLPNKWPSSSKRVCWQWRNTAKGLLSIQKKLFVTHGFMHGLVESHSGPKRTEISTMNPMLEPYVQNLGRAGRVTTWFLAECSRLPAGHD